MGDFYEAFGVDAVMLVEYAGLNPMGGKCAYPYPTLSLSLILSTRWVAGAPTLTLP